MALPFECLDSLGRDLYNEDGIAQYQILLFGSTETGDSICVQVEGYHPSFLIELPKGCTIRPAVTAFKNWILDAMEGSTGIIFTHERHKTLWDYNLEAYSDFIKLECVSLKAWRKCKELLLDDHSLPLELPTFRVLGSDGVSVAGPRCKMQVYEANLDPLLRFFHEQDLAPASWMQVTDWEEAETKEANTKLFVTCDWKSISVLPPTSPLLKIHAPLLICAWDIECTSAHGDFPLPKKTWRKQAREALEKKVKTYPALCSAIAEAFLGTKGSLLSSVHLRDKGARPLVTSKDVELALDGRKSAIQSALRSDSLEEGTDALDTALTASLPAIAGDPIIQIGMVLYRNGVPVRKHIWVLGGCDREAVKPPGLEVPIEVYVFHDETALLRAWCRWMSDNDPDVLVGYNVFGFDEKFVWDRAKELHIESALAPWSRLGTTKPALEKKELSSAAMGDNTMYMLKSIGRLQVDMLHYVRKNYPLDSYTLDNVSATFVSGAVVGALKEEGKETFRFGTKSTKGTVVGRFITLLDEENDRVVDRCIVVGVEPKALVVKIDGGKAVLDEHGAAPVRWAQVKDDISPQQIFASQRGSDKDRALIAKYCLQDCDLVMELFQKLDVLNNAIAMANVCSVPVGFIFTRGQGVKIESLIFKEARKEDKLICGLSVTPRDSVEELSDDPSYEGAIVLDPKTGIYIDDPVTVLDFASLYPSTIISENISHDTLIWVKEYNLKGDFVKLVEGSDTFDNLVGASYVNIEFDLLVPDPASSLKHPPKVKLGTRIARYIQVPIKGRDSIGNEGTIPKILKMLLSSRKAARKEAEKETDEFRKALLDAKQLAYKLTANSLYGQLGSGTFKVRRQVLAASTTAYGRKQLLFAKECIETVYGGGKDLRCNAEYVYGDTDSVFMKFNPKNPVTGERLHGMEALVAAKAITEEAGHLVSGCLKAPHDFEFDKMFRTFCLLSKKRYVGDMTEGDLDDFHRKAMGIVMKRRDNAPIVKYVYGGVIDRILDPSLTDSTEGVKSAFAFVQETARNLLQGKVPMSKLTITKSLRSEYADPTRIAHKVLADRMAERDPGNAPSTTERIPFVYILPHPGMAPSKLQGDRIELPSYIREKNLKIDYPHYITNQIAKPIAQVFGLEVEKLPGVTRSALLATSNAKDPIVAREALAQSLLFDKLLLEASRTPETMERKGQTSITKFLKGTS